MKLLLSISTFLFLAVPFGAQAELYRCGNSYQDTPCVNKKPTSVKKLPRTNTTVESADASSPEIIAADCKQRGESAKKIMWMRESGKTAEDQIATASDAATKNLIVDVYNHQGSSLQVKNAIERECMQQKEKDALAEKLMIEAQRLRNGGAVPTANPTKTANTQPSADSSNATAPKPENSIALQCSDIKMQMARVADKRRLGGSAVHMENLRQEQQHLIEQQKSLGCQF